MSNFTPGPWGYYEPNDRECAGGYCSPSGCMGHPSGYYLLEGPPAYDDAAIHLANEADARLIAASPDLLEACQEALRFIRGGSYTVHDQLRAAIAKATE